MGHLEVIHVTDLNELELCDVCGEKKLRSIGRYYPVAGVEVVWLCYVCNDQNDKAKRSLV